jgi:hypothetical protein
VQVLNWCAQGFRLSELFGGLVNGEGYNMSDTELMAAAGRLEAASQRTGKKRPTGFVAVCQCGKAVGAIDLERSDRADTSRLLGKWLMDGCVVYPQLTSTWAAHIEPCACSDPPNAELSRPAGHEEV